MSIWKQRPSLEMINGMSDESLVSHLGIEFTEVTEDGLVATMPVDSRTRQPFGILHGGASVVLSETLASVAANFAIDQSESNAVGLELNANHIRSVRDGIVTGIATAIHIGGSTHVWQVRIVKDDKLVSIHRITMAILSKKK